MQLKFRTDEHGDLKVYIMIDGQEKNFAYIEMIKILYNHNTIEDPIFDETVSLEEQDRIREMLTEISESIIEKGEVDI